MPHCYAQTNIQLYNQMREMGCAQGDIEQMKEAYDFSLRLFSGQYRPNGKPFINHLVGTASILVAETAELRLAIAALLHAAYTHGHFSVPILNLPPLKRRKLAQMLGNEVEALIYAYTSLKWNEASLKDLTRRASELSETKRNVVVIRLANEIEDHLDIGLRYGGKVKSMYRQEHILQLLHELAASLGHAALARRLEENVIEQRKTAIPKSLSRKDSTSFHMPLRISTWLKRKLKSLVSRYVLR